MLSAYCARRGGGPISISNDNRGSIPLVRATPRVLPGRDAGADRCCMPGDKEKRSDLIRETVERELKRREGQAGKKR